VPTARTASLITPPAGENHSTLATLAIYQASTIGHGIETTVKVPEEVKVWIVLPPDVVIVPPVQVAVPVG